MDEKIREVREKAYKEEVKAISLIWNEEKFSIEDIALQMNRSTNWVRTRLKAAKKMGLVTSIKFKKKKLSEKNEKIINMWNKGIHTLDEIGQEFFVTRERIRQILKKAKSDGIFVEEVQNVSSERSKNRLHEKASKVNKNEFAYDYVNNIPTEIVRLKYDLTNNTYKYLEKLIIKEGIISPRDKVINSVINYYENPDEVTAQREEIILEMKEKNKSNDEIACSIGVSSQRLDQHIRKMKDKGIEIPNTKFSGPTMPEEEIQEQVDMIDILLDKGLNMRKISKSMGISSHRVKILIYRHLC